MHFLQNRQLASQDDTMTGPASQQIEHLAAGSSRSMLANVLDERVDVKVE
jgi:hypothetical protein